MNTGAPPSLSKAGTGMQVTPVTLERHEYKYVIPGTLVDKIAAFALPYCSFDRYSTLSEDGFYLINSLYYDTPSYHFLQQRINKAENRFNMRIRSYGGTPRPPFFLEIKHRRGDLVCKYRALCRNGNIREVLDGPTGETGGTGNDANRDLFIRTVLRYGAGPVVLMQYRRKALFSTCDDYARVTFDTGLRYMPAPGYEPVPDDTALLPCEDAGDGDVVLELKCLVGRVPLWMVDLVRCFQLEKRGFSKYSLCVRSVIGRDTVVAPSVRRPVPIFNW